MVSNFIGKRFGRLLVVSRAENDKFGNAQWNCICDCGNKVVQRTNGLSRGIVVSCGCYNREKLNELRTTHNSSKTRLFRIWQYMKGRCYNKNNTAYSYYGGRGITVCDEWRESFEAFREWSLKNGYTDELTLDRIDPDANYCPDNCRWADRKTQMRNRRVCRIFTINGITKDLKTWCEDENVPYQRVRQRLQNGWDIEAALYTPKLKPNGTPASNK